MYKFIHLLLIRVYWAMLITWLCIIAIGLYKHDAKWTLMYLTQLLPYVLSLIGIAVVHWIIIYREDEKREQRKDDKN